jgi:hypothetical protein
MLSHYLHSIEIRCLRATERATRLSYYALRLALLCTLLVFVTGGDALLSVLAGYDKVAESVTWQFLYKQVQSPLTTFSDREPYHHISKMTYRLVPAYLGKLCLDCSLKNLMLFLIGIEYLAGFFFFYFVYRLIVSYCQDRVAATWIVLGFCFLFLGKIFFWDIYAYFDAYALLFLLLALRSHRTLAVFFFMLAAYWTDERALVASALVWVWAMLPDAEATGRSLGKRLFSFSAAQWAVVGALLLTIVLRGVLSSYYGMPPGANLTQVLTEARQVLVEKRLLELIPLVTLSGFESYWVYILGGLGVMWLRRDYLFLSLMLLALAASLGVSYLVYDMTRSLMYAFPALLIGIRIVVRELSPDAFRTLTFWTMILAMLYPTYYLSHYMWPLFIRLLRFY